MPIAIEKTPLPATGCPAWSLSQERDNELNIAVLFTSVESTLAALKEAATLANQLSARIRLIVPQIVPYPLSLETPPVQLEFSKSRFRVMASESGVETSVQIVLCRDRFTALKSALQPGSIVVLGGPKRWWPTESQMLARRLRRAGYEVIFKETE